jgi:hypothetical protein
MDWLALTALAITVTLVVALVMTAGWMRGATRRPIIEALKNGPQSGG